MTHAEETLFDELPGGGDFVVVYKGERMMLRSLVDIIKREAVVLERERLAAVFAVAAVRYASRLKYPDDVWKEVQAHLAEPSE